MPPRTPFASFCISTFKRPAYLTNTLESIREQTFGDYEVVISDNDTEQSGREVVESMNDTRFRYFANSGNLGMKKSFNESLRRSTGRFIVMIADDDPVYPFMLKTLFDLYEEFPGYGMYMGGCDWYCTSHKVGALYGFKVGTNSCLSSAHDLGYKKAFSPDEFLKSLYSFSIFPHYLWSTCIVERNILIKNNGVPEYGTPFLGDYAYLSMAASHSGAVIINRALGCQTLHEENFGRKQNDQLEVAARNFPAYVREKASHLRDWPIIEPLMLRFTALWLVSHMSFLYSYYRKHAEKDEGFLIAEEKVFNIDYMKPYRFKYFLKKKMPFLHNFLVRAKKVFN
jgi:glycosyltransferase involved in cell wall biosynthesis